jgi:8-amino-7-oxononanoate synthase
VSLVADWAAEATTALADQHLLREVQAHAGRAGPLLEIDGRTFINFSSNDALGLASHPKLVCAAHVGLERYGVGAGSSRLVVGETEVVRQLESRLALFEGFDAALCFGSGWAANTGLLPVLAQEGDVIFSDALNHASLVDGCRASKAKTVVYPHGDVVALERLLQATPARRRVVVTDTVFSMDGDVAPLQSLRQVCDAYKAALVVDEAHATGVLGATGRGACELAGIRPDVLVGTLSKALGAVGAYVCGPAALRAWLVTSARPFVFSTALPPHLALVTQAALDVVRDEPQRRAALMARVEQLAQGLTRLGWPANRASHITSVVLGSPEKAVAAAQVLATRGLWVRPIRPPTVPAGTSRLRISLSAAHSEAQVAALIDALKGVVS